MIGSVKLEIGGRPAVIVRQHSYLNGQNLVNVPDEYVNKLGLPEGPIYLLDPWAEIAALVNRLEKIAAHDGKPYRTYRTRIYDEEVETTTNQDSPQKMAKDAVAHWSRVQGGK